LVTYKEKSYLRRSWPWWRLVITFLSIAALVLSAVMSWHYLAGEPMIGCGGGSPCEQVLSSRWSVIAGMIPVSGLAMGVYLTILVASFFIGPSAEAPVRMTAWGVILILAGSVAGSAIWFIILQKWVIGSFCLYCMTAHVTGLLMAAIIIWRANTTSDYWSDEVTFKRKSIMKETSSPISEPVIRPLYAAGLVLSGFLLAGMLAGSQLIFAPPAAYHDGESQDNLHAIDDYYSVPIVGSPDATYIVTLLFDYQCSYCQKIHFMLDEAVKRYDGKLAFALSPAPLSPLCNPYIAREADEFKNSCELTRTGLAVWLADRDMFPAFETWMFTFESGDRWRPRSPEDAREKAVELVGKEKLDAAWSDPWIEQYLHIAIGIYGNTLQGGRGGIPKLVYGSRWVIPEPNNADDLIMILQNSLLVPKP